EHSPSLPTGDARVVDASVDAFWSYDGSGEPHRVLPDGCMDIVFDLSTGRARAVGAMAHAKMAYVGAGERLFGVRFRPGRAALLFDVHASELLDVDAPIEDVLGGRGALLQ